MEKKKPVKQKKTKVTVVKKVKVVKAAKKISFADWVTFDVAKATYRIGHNADAHFGVFLLQIKKAEDGVWLTRTVEKNGTNEEPGRVTLVREGQAVLYCEKARAIAGAVDTKIKQLMAD